MTKEKIMEVLESLETNNLIAVHNEYCDAVRCEEDRIYYMTELDDLFYGCTFTEVMNKIDKSSFDLDDDYWHDTIYGIESLDEEEAIDIIDLDEIAEYILDNETDLYCREISELMEVA